MTRDPMKFVPVQIAAPLARAPEEAAAFLRKANVANERPVLERHTPSEPPAATRGKLFLCAVAHVRAHSSALHAAAHRYA